MRHPIRCLLARRAPALSLLSLLAVAAAVSPARAVVSGPWSMEVLVDGTPLEELAARGTTYVEAVDGHEYSIRLRNLTADRVAVALSVDGLNTIDARTTTTFAGAKWILGPYETIVLNGWQTASDTARRFYFTTEDRSYGAWLGETSNLGVITAAFFRERRPRPTPIDAGHGRKRSRAVPAPSAPPAAEEPRAGRLKSESEGLDRDALSDEYAATGIGREVGHAVRRVRFEAEPRPAATLRLRYEYRDALVRLGVIRGPRCDEPLARRERARGFDDLSFAPDPFRRR